MKYGYKSTSAFGGSERALPDLIQTMENKINR